MSSTIPPSEPTPVRHERGADRVEAELLVEMDGAEGLTHNISATGVYFEINPAHAPGTKIRFTVDVVVGEELMKLACDGEVVRVDQLDGTVGIAAKVLKSVLFQRDEASDDA
jgi:hypothetical protein